MCRRRLLVGIVVLLICFFSACTTVASPPEKITETVITTVVDVDPTLEVLVQVDNEEVAKFTKEILDITSNCQASTFLYDFRSDTILYGYKAGIKSVRDKCNLKEIEIEIPKYCEPCRNVIPIIQEHAKLMVEGVDLIEKANASLNQELLTEGLDKFWDAEIVWKDVKNSIDGIRTVYNLPVVLKR